MSVKRIALLSALVLGLVSRVVVGDTPKDNVAQEQKKELQGVWVTTGTKGFDKDEDKDVKALRLTFKGESLTAEYNGKTAEAVYKLILTKAGPSQMDVTIAKGPDAVKGKTYPAIYLLEGGTLKISYREPGKQRPAAFDDEGEAGVYTIMFKKEKK
jgi:uncharacterized protein (TIGR03067 family)